MKTTTRIRTLSLLGALAALGLGLGSLFGPPGGAAAARRADDTPKAKKVADPAAGVEKAIRQAGEAYVAALNAGDLERIMSFWAPDADYIDESGQLTRGRE